VPGSSLDDETKKELETSGGHAIVHWTIFFPAAMPRQNLRIDPNSEAANQAGGTQQTESRWGWVNVAVAATLMLATLPGRTQGLGLITEPLLKDLNLDRVSYATINLWATLFGAAFCFPAGYMIDRLGLRWVSAATSLLLGLVVWQMSRFSGGPIGLFVLLFATRALGQSALSVTSITTVGKSFGRRAGLAMGLYSFLLSVFFIIAFVVVGATVTNKGWRVAWSQIAQFLALIVTPMALLLLREGSFVQAPGEGNSRQLAPVGNRAESFTLVQALRTYAFWIFGLSTALFALVSSGLGLFNEAVLAERGFNQSTYHTFLAVTTFAGLLGQLVCGWLALRASLRRLLSMAMLLYAVGLVMLPFVKSFHSLWVFAVIIGLTGGFITVLFFAIWSHAFGRRHLGHIQGAAQLLTVLASALGPLLFAKCVAVTGSYTPLLLTLAVVVLLLGIVGWNVALPDPEKINQEQIAAVGATQPMQGMRS
jgi:MFS family permease